MMNKAALVLLLANTAISVHVKTVEPSLQAQVRSLKVQNAALKQIIKKFEGVQKIESRNLKQFDAPIFLVVELMVEQRIFTLLPAPKFSGCFMHFAFKKFIEMRWLVKP